MKATVKLISFLFVCFAFGYNHIITSTTHSKSNHTEWSYHGETSPEHWKEFEEYSDCNGQRQSPVNIIHQNTEDSAASDDLKILYSPFTLLKKVNNNGHSIQFDFDKGDSIQYHNSTYYLKQIHFHEPSEHKINGVIYPIEIHLVHQNKEGQFTVLGILGEEGKESQLFEFLESFLPLRQGETKTINKPTDLSSLFTSPKRYYAYGGSLTTPPCTESVNWILFKNPMILSVEEINKLRENMPLNNFRNEQPLNNRIVNYHSD